MTKEIVKVGKFEYEPRVLNGLTEPAARRIAIRKLAKFEDSKGWEYSEETKTYNPLEGEAELEREIYFELTGRLIAILASDKRNVTHSVEAIGNLIILAENDEAGFTALYKEAVEANPGFKVEKEETANPN